MYYDRATNRVHLLDDQGVLWLTATPGSTGTLQNGQCAITLSTTTVTLGGTVLTLNLAMTFDTSFGGAKNVYLFADGAGGASSGWQARGTWTVANTSGL